MVQPATLFSNLNIHCKHNFKSHNFMVAPCINNIKQFIVQLMHKNYKILGLLK